MSGSVAAVKLLTLAEALAPIQDPLAAVERRLHGAVANQHPSLRAATEALLSAGGKRLRPAVALLTAGLLAADMERAVSLAAAVEMLHTASLVHDDLIDGALLRRGAATLNAHWPPGASILTGDYLFAAAADLAAQTGDVRVMAGFARTLMVMVNGEIQQMLSPGEAAGRSGYLGRIYAKTAALFVLATEAAALLAGADQARTAAVVEYGRALGTAFQMVDDVLDYTGDPAQTGKPAGSDLRQGLVTLPALYYLEMRPDDPDLTALLNGRRGDPAMVARAIESVRRSGAIEAALDEARGLAVQAQAALNPFFPSVHADALAALAGQVIDRCA